MEINKPIPDSLKEWAESWAKQINEAPTNTQKRDLEAWCKGKDISLTRPKHYKGWRKIKLHGVFIAEVHYNTLDRSNLDSGLINSVNLQYDYWK